MFREFLSDIFSPHSSFFDRFIGAFIILCIIAIVILLGLITYKIVDTKNVPFAGTAETMVEAKQITPAHLTSIMIGKVVGVQYHPRTYQICFRMDGWYFYPNVSKGFFDYVNIGDKIEVDYGFGRLSGLYHLIGIRLVNQ